MKITKRNKNFLLLDMLWRRGRRQYSLVHDGAITSEARASRIINGLVCPTKDEIRRICNLLECKPSDVGLR